LKGELPIEVADLEDELEGLHHRRTRVEEEANGINEFIEQKKVSYKIPQQKFPKTSSIMIVFFIMPSLYFL